MGKSESISTRYGRRAMVAALALVSLGGVIWLICGVSDYPRWFLAVLLGLVVINLLNWVLEPVPKPPHASCRRCGRMRAVEINTPCACGATGLRMPWLSRAAFAMIILLLGVIGIWLLSSALESREMEERTKGLGVGLLMLTLAVAVVAEAIGFRVTRRLRRAFGSVFPYEFEGDVEQLRWHRYLAVRVIMLVLSVAIFAGAAGFLMRHP